jgi:hypothetical protein
LQKIVQWGRGILLLSALVIWVTNAQGQRVVGATAPVVDGAYFTHEVQPILQKSCLGCHGVGARLSGLDLSSRKAALLGGTRGSAFVAGSASKSVLYQMVTGIRSPQMPPTGKLPAKASAVLKKWLDGGAPYADAPVTTAQKQVWWAFKPPVRPPIPTFGSVFSEIGSDILSGSVGSQSDRRFCAAKAACRWPESVSSRFQDHPYSAGDDGSRRAAAHSGRGTRLPCGHLPAGLRKTCRSAAGVSSVRRTLGAALARCCALC